MKQTKKVQSAKFAKTAAVADSGPHTADEIDWIKCVSANQHATGVGYYKGNLLSVDVDRNGELTGGPISMAEAARRMLALLESEKSLELDSEYSESAMKSWLYAIQSELPDTV